LSHGKFLQFRGEKCSKAIGFQREQEEASSIRNSPRRGERSSSQKQAAQLLVASLFSFLSQPPSLFLSFPDKLYKKKQVCNNATSNLLRLLLAVAFIVAASARSSSPRPAPAPAAPAAASAQAPAAPPRAPKTVAISWGFPHAPRPRLSVAPGDTLTFSWDQIHGVYSLGKVAEAKLEAGGSRKELRCEDFNNFRDARGFLTVEPRRENYYGPQRGSVSWVAPEQEGVYAFADPIEQNCWAGMLLVVDVERPKAVPAASAPAPAPSTGKKNGNNSKKPASAAAAVPAAAPAPAPAAAAAVSVASVSPSQQAAFVEGGPSFVEEEGGPAAEMTPRERQAARVAEREAAREQRQMQRAVEEGRVDFEQQHVIED